MRSLLAGLDLLDRRIVDAEGRPYATVDDLELVEHDDGTLEVVALLLGPKALGPRIGGRLGRAIVGMARRASGTDAPIRIPLELVEEFGVVVKLRRKTGELPAMPLEAWMRDHVVAPIPGSDRATG